MNPNDLEDMLASILVEEIAKEKEAWDKKSKDEKQSELDADAISSRKLREAIDLNRKK